MIDMFSIRKCEYKETKVLKPHSILNLFVVLYLENISNKLTQSRSRYLSGMRWDFYFLPVSTICICCDRFDAMYHIDIKLYFALFCSISFGMPIADDKYRNTNTLVDICVLGSRPYTILSRQFDLLWQIKFEKERKKGDHSVPAWMWLHLFNTNVSNAKSALTLKIDLMIRFIRPLAAFSRLSIYISVTFCAHLQLNETIAIRLGFSSLCASILVLSFLFFHIQK